MFDTVRRLKPRRSLEIGLAYGFSTVYILAAMEETGVGRHLALDPFQANQWHGVGALQARHFGMEQSFQLLEEYSSVALARLARLREEFEFIYIDGNHRFDDVLVDFTLSAEVCPIGGNIILDDMWMPAIRTAVSWVRSNRSDFREIPTPVGNIAHFERIGKDQRAWNHYVRFEVSRTIEEASTLPRRIGRHIKRLLVTDRR